jgi:membrane-associated phospholipid phosphatase
MGTGSRLLKAAEFMLMAFLLPASGWAQDSAPGARQAVQAEASSAQPALADARRQKHREKHKDKDDKDMDEPGFLAPGTDPDNRPFLPLLRHMAADQLRFWTSPAELRRPEAWKTFAPFAGLTGLLVASDRSLAKRVPAGADSLRRSQDISSYATYSLMGTAGGAYLWGHLARNERLAETGFLSGEAALDSTLAAIALQQVARRPRPLEGTGGGRFFQGGPSFPSEHSALAWSVASTVAHEYPGPLTKVAAYGLASAVTLTRVTSKEHFPSDAVVGSALGWYFARQIYRARHDAELGGAAWGKLAANDEAAAIPVGGDARAPDRMGSPNVALDSWIYPALARLAAFGYIQTSFAGLKPWTRMECAQMTEEAGEALERAESVNPEAVRIEAALREEFAGEFDLLDGGRNLGIELESVYLRDVSMSGPVLTDGFHFGQTLANDFGRPFRRGDNGQAGASLRAAAGPFALYVRAEFQHTPGARALSDAERSFIAAADLVPAPPATPFAAINRPRVLDAYLGLNAGRGWQFSFGYQSLEWAPGPGASMLWSDNARPVPMFRLLQTGVRLPSILKWLGPARVDSFFGWLEGHSFIPHPYIYCNKIDFKPLPNLELGFGRSVIIGGRGGDPLTGENLLLSFFGRVRNSYNSVPGSSHAGFDWTYYVPRTGNYLAFYGEMYANDDPVPWFNPPKNPYRPGLWITRFPRLGKLDFHIEAANSESPGQPHNTGNLNYWNHEYRDGYTNGGNLIGNTVGRMGRTIQCWLTYWISPANTMQFTYKHDSVSPDFVPKGGYWQDYGLSQQWYFGSGLYLKSQAQYEHISSYPLLFSGPQKNVTAIVELGVIPRRKK